MIQSNEYNENIIYVKVQAQSIKSLAPNLSIYSGLDASSRRNKLYTVYRSSELIVIIPYRIVEIFANNSLGEEFTKNILGISYKDFLMIAIIGSIPGEVQF